MSEPDPSQRTNGSVIRADVGIIGAGPAGLATAVHLGRLGVNRVILVDRADFPRDKTCGSAVSPKGCEMLKACGRGRGGDARGLCDQRAAAGDAGDA